MLVHGDIKRGMVRWLCALLILLAATYAVLPGGSPLEDTSGSAFSATTTDVAVGCRGREAIEREVRPEPAHPPAEPCVITLAVNSGPEIRSDLRPDRHSRAPPIPDPVFTPLSPRAPPAA